MRYRILSFGFSLYLIVSAVLAFPSHTRAAASIQGLHVSGNMILNSDNQPIRLLGVDRSGGEFACVQGKGIWDGPMDAGAVQAMAAWKINAVRVPLNEDCWLDINGIDPTYSGSSYRQAVGGYVNLLNSNGLVAILDLHWNAPGTSQATGQQPMPDNDHVPAFWTSVASAFKNNSSVIFDLYNEPYPDHNKDTTAAWTCWANGGNCAGIPFPVAGMQTLVTAVRDTGATNVIMLGGVQYSNSLSQWLAYKPMDPTGNLVASWHVYNFNSCSNSSCWDREAGPVAQQVPLIAGEIGEDDCAHGFVDSLMGWLDTHNASYLGWTWNAWDCKKGPALISDYSGIPTALGQGLKDHFAAVSQQPTIMPGEASTPPAHPGRAEARPSVASSSVGTPFLASEFG
ncbi:MAG: glycoside hydrolase family 5 protein [Aggregatilineales bacterium]